MGESIRILFVDDERKVLDGLRRMLYGMRSRWKMSFAIGGHAALEKLEARPFDVVISDMRMPGMMGVDLLRRVRESYPHIIRIALSGQASPEMVLQSTEPTHQYLIKPCDLDLLSHTVDRLAMLNALVSSKQVKSIAAGAVSLPSDPKSYDRMVAWADSDAAIDSLLDIVTGDVALSGKIMQMVSSAFFGQVSGLMDIPEAVSFLGADNMRSLIASVGIFNRAESEQTVQLARSVCKHSSHVAAALRAIMELEDVSESVMKTASVVGILHDIGKLVLGELPEISTKALEQQTDRFVQQEAENTIGVRHCEVGAYMLGIWGLDEQIVSAVACHHTFASVSYGSENALLMAAVHVADAITHASESGGEAKIDLENIANLGFADRLEAWKDSALCTRT